MMQIQKCTLKPESSITDSISKC